MTDNVAMNFRKRQAEPSAAPPAPAAATLPTRWLVIGAALVGFAVASFAMPGSGQGLLSRVARLGASAPPAAAPQPGPEGPRVISVIPGIKETAAGSGLGLAGPAALTLAYVPVGPVVFRTGTGYVEVDGPRLVPPPVGRQRSYQALLDHSARLGNELRALAFTPCDQHLRYLAAANVTLFVGGFFAPRTRIATDAPANAAFWNQPEASTVRRAVLGLAEKGALTPADFGLDTSPEIKGLFQNARMRPISCR